MLSNWGLTLDAAPIKLKGRVMPPETIVFKNREVRANEQADFSRDAGKGGFSCLRVTTNLRSKVTVLVSIIVNKPNRY